MPRYLVVATTTTVKHYEIKAENTEEAREKVAGNPIALRYADKDTILRSMILKRLMFSQIRLNLNAQNSQLITKN